jgi:hypothetical protein
MVKDKNDKALMDTEKYFKDKLSLGREEIEPEDIPTPVLLLTQDISKVRDEKGNKIPAGKFYYSGTGEVFDEVKVSMLIVSKKDTPDFQTKLPTRTHIYLGVIYPELRPFLMFFRNTGLFSSKTFQGKVTALQVPMYCVNVTLTAEQTTFEKNTWWKTVFRIDGIRSSMAEIVILEDLLSQYQPGIKETIQKTEEEAAKVEESLPWDK